jgi:hypothetical protein
MVTYLVLFAISACLKIWVLRVGWKRHILAQFRWFFIYISYNIVDAIIRLVVFVYAHTYGQVYWATEIVAILLLAIAIRESFVSTFPRQFREISIARVASWICLAPPFVYSLSVAVFAPPVTASGWIPLIINAEFTMQCMIAAIAVLYLALWWLFNFPGYPYELGIMLGFLINGCGSGAAYLIRSMFGMRFHALWTWLPSIAFMIAECIWVATLSWAHVVKELKPTIPVTEEMLEEMDGYSVAMKRLRRWH